MQPTAPSDAQRAGSIEFPAMCDATLDQDTLTALFDDIIERTTVLEVLCKRGPRRHADTAPVSATDALSWLLGADAGQPRAVQLRYLHDDAQWLDTVLSAGPQCWRLVRVRHGLDLTSPPSPSPERTDSHG